MRGSGELVRTVVSSHLSSAQADVEQVEVLGSFGGEARTVHQSSHRTQRAEVKGHGDIAIRVREVTVAVAQAVVLEQNVKHKVRASRWMSLGHQFWLCEGLQLTIILIIN